MFTKAEIAQTWSRWCGVYVVVLMLITWKFRLTPVVSGIFVGVGTLAAAAVTTPSSQRRVWVWVLASIGLGMFVGFWVSHFGPG